MILQPQINLSTVRNDALLKYIYPKVIIELCLPAGWHIETHIGKSYVSLMFSMSNGVTLSGYSFLFILENGKPPQPFLGFRRSA